MSDLKTSPMANSFQNKKVLWKVLYKNLFNQAKELQPNTKGKLSLQIEDNL